MFMHPHLKKKKLFEKLFINGVALGFLNPKSYPVMISVFAALLINDVKSLDFSQMPMLFVIIVLSFIAGNSFIIVISGFTFISSFYTKNIRYFCYGFGILYIVFGLNLLLETFL